MKLNQNGDTATIVIFTLAFLAVVFLGLSAWALFKYNEERTTVDEQVAAAVEVARADQQEQAEAEFETERRNPWRTYRAPDIFGGIAIDLPKNWSIYVEDTTSGRTQIDLFIHPDKVRVQRGSEDPYAFRMQLRNDLYQDVVRGYQRDVEQGRLQSRTIKVSGIDGVRLTGQITRDQIGSMVVLPYRDKTITLWTEGDRYRSEFNDILDRASISR